MNSLGQLTLTPEMLITALIGLLAGFLLGLLIRSLLAQKLINAEKERRIVAEANIKKQEELDEERDTALELARERLENAFHDLADQSLSKNNDQFLQLATQKLNNQQQHASSELDKRQTSIQNLIKPISEALNKTEAQIGDIEKNRRQSFGELKQELLTLRTTHTELQTETRNLVNALRKPQVRGRWGEQTLKRLVELAGMVNHCDFSEQVSTGHGDDQSFRPDMVVSLPDQRYLVVDAKTPLQAYLDALESSDPVEEKNHMQRHLRHIKTHIKQLASKEYWQSLSNTPEFVIMFIPGEQFLSVAVDMDPELFDFALQKNIILATPSNLIALLKTVSYGWQQVELAKNAENIRKLGEVLHKRLNIFVTHLAKIGTNLQRSNKAYNDAVGSLERNVLSSARKFKEMGIRASDDLAKIESVEQNIRVPKLSNEVNQNLDFESNKNEH